MPTRLDAVVVDAADPPRLAAFWARALGWAVTHDAPEEASVGVTDAPAWGDGGAPAVVFTRVEEPKSVKNRVHLELASGNRADQLATVSRLLDLGASRADIGQEEAPWVVLADPEGNEFCVLDARETHRDVGPLAAVVVDCADSVDLANFWMRATGWPVLRYSERFAALRHPSASTTWWELIEVPEPKTGRNRLRPDLAPRPGSDVPTEVARLERLGARHLDDGRGGGSSVAMADPEGNEFCVRPPRRRPHAPTGRRR
ncbi:MAG TPA: VOC family protein [Egibacteraceae bacterium]|nr:VOC family protein [Egibacteraceae bacterium]